MKRPKRYTAGPAAAAAAAVLIFLASTLAAGSLSGVTTEQTADGVKIKLTGDQKFKYRMKGYDNPPRVVIQLYGAKNAGGFESMAVDQGMVDKIKVNEAQYQGTPATFVTVVFEQAAKYDFDVSRDGREFTLTVFGKGTPKKSSTPPALTNYPADQYDWITDNQKTTPKSAQSSGRRVKTFEEVPKSSDKSPYVEGPINIVDADPSKAMQVISEAFGKVSILLDKSIIEEEAQARQTGSATGITLTLTNVTLEEALDIITASNDWAWQKIGEIYAITSRETDDRGFTLLNTAKFYDTGRHMDVMVFRPKFINACNFSVYVSTIIPISEDYFSCDSYANIAMLRGEKKDLDRAERLFVELDTAETRDATMSGELSREYRETQEFVTRVIKLKYISALTLQNRMSTLMGNAYFGNVQLVTGGPVVERQADNTISLDESTNTLVFVGREKIYNRILALVNQLDAPYSATLVRMIPLKYVRVEDLQTDLMKNVTYLSSEVTGENNFTSTQQPFMFGRSSTVFFSVDTNSVTFVGTEDDYDRLIQLINTFDVETREVTTEVVVLEDIRVEDLMGDNYNELLKPVLSLQEYGYGRAQLTYSQAANSIVVTSQRMYMEKIKRLIREFDNDTGQMQIREFRLKYINAYRAARILSAHFGNFAGGEEEEDTAGEGELGGPPPDGGFYQFDQSGDITDAILSNAASVVYQSYQYRDYQSNIFEGFYDYNKYVIYHETSRNAVIVQGTKRLMKKVQEMIKMIDVPYPQIKIDVNIVELFKGRDKTLALGYLYNDRHFVGGSELLTPTTAATANPVGLDYGFFLYDTAVDMVSRYAGSLAALVTNDYGRVIAQPSMVVPENAPADFNFTENYPYVQGSTVTEQGQTTQQVEFVPLGYRILLTTHFTPDGYIILKVVYLGVTSMKGTVNLQGSIVPIVSNRAATTEIKLKDGEPLIIGGLTTSSLLETKSKVPVLGDLPGIGKLFRSKGTSASENEVIFVITPTIIPIDCDPTDGTICEKTASAR